MFWSPVRESDYGLIPGVVLIKAFKVKRKRRKKPKNWWEKIKFQFSVVFPNLALDFLGVRG